MAGTRKLKELAPSTSTASALIPSPGAKTIGGTAAVSAGPLHAVSPVAKAKPTRPSAPARVAFSSLNIHNHDIH